MTTNTEATTTKIYVNMEFAKLIADINSGTLAHQFNGKGRKVALLPEALESNYISYSSDKAGTQIMPQPFEINNGDNIKFKQQATPNDKSGASSSWKGIIQNRYDLRLVKGEKSTYNAVATEGATSTGSEEDEVIINVNFKLNGEKFSVAWDPRVKIGKG